MIHLSRQKKKKKEAAFFLSRPLLLLLLLPFFLLLHFPTFQHPSFASLSLTSLSPIRLCGVDSSSQSVFESSLRRLILAFFFLLLPTTQLINYPTTRNTYISDPSFLFFPSLHVFAQRIFIIRYHGIRNIVLDSCLTSSHYPTRSCSAFAPPFKFLGIVELLFSRHTIQSSSEG